MKKADEKALHNDEIDKTYRIHMSKGVMLHYLEALQKDILQRDWE